MKRIPTLALYIALNLLSAAPGVALADFEFRALVGVGQTNTNLKLPGKDRDNQHVAIQLLNKIPNDSLQRGWGIELGKHTVLSSDQGDLKFDSIGIIVQSNLFANFVGQLGTVGYIDTDDSNHAPFGFRLSLGIDNDINNSIFYSLRVRQDMIFDTKEIYAGSLEAGLGYKF